MSRHIKDSRRTVADEYAAMPFTPDPFGDWIRAHRDEMARHVGWFVAIDPAVGIVGAGRDPVALAREHGPDVMVTFVRAEDYAPAP